MNRVIISGVIARDPEYRQVGENTVCNFTVATRRGYRNKDGKYMSDYLNCTVWGKTAEYMQKFAANGVRCLVSGSIESRSYDDKNGQRKYVTEIRAESVEMFGPSNPAPQEQAPAPAQPVYGTPNYRNPVDSSSFPPPPAGFTVTEDNELPF